MTTLRDRIEDAILEIDCGSPEAARIDLLAALAILDESKRTFGKYEGRIVLDPAREEATP